MEPSSRIKLALEKYWMAETSVAEEEELKQFFAQNPRFAGHPAAAMFSYLHEEKQVIMTGSKEDRVETFTESSRFMRWMHPLLKVSAGW